MGVLPAPRFLSRCRRGRGPYPDGPRPPVARAPGKPSRPVYSRPQRPRARRTKIPSREDRNPSLEKAGYPHGPTDPWPPPGRGTCPPDPGRALRRRPPARADRCSSQLCWAPQTDRRSRSTIEPGSALELFGTDHKPESGLRPTMRPRPPWQPDFALRPPAEPRRRRLFERLPPGASVGAARSQPALPRRSAAPANEPAPREAPRRRVT